MAWLRSGIKPLKPQADTAPTQDRASYLTEVSREAQRAEAMGDSLRAEVAHRELNREL